MAALITIIAVIKKINHDFFTNKEIKKTVKNVVYV